MFICARSTLPLVCAAVYVQVIHVAKSGMYPFACVCGVCTICVHCLAWRDYWELWTTRSSINLRTKKMTTASVAPQQRNQWTLLNFAVHMLRVDFWSVVDSAMCLSAHTHTNTCIQNKNTPGNVFSWEIPHVWQYIFHWKIAFSIRMPNEVVVVIASLW